MENAPRARLRKRLKNIFDAIRNENIKTNILHAIPFWIASLLTGLIAVAYTRLFNLSESMLGHLMSWHKGVIFILAPACLLSARGVVKLFAPGARGSGIPQVMAAIDLSSAKYGPALSALLNGKIILTKIASSLLMVLGGGAIGREGPTIQIAGSVFRLVNKYTPISWPRLSQKSFILTGAAAGLAAAFNTPLGGIVFAMEELARIHISFFRTALFTAVIIAGLTAQGFLGPYLYLGYPDVRNLSTAVFAGVIAVAILAGLLGSIMCKTILYLMKWKRSFTNSTTIAYICCTGLIIAFFAYFINTDILGSGKTLMNTVLFTTQKHVSLTTMLFRILGPVLSFNIGAAGGIFAPALAGGAAVGSYFSSVFGVIGSNANILILSGMVGFLTGVTRTPFTSAILVLEMTDRHSVIFHLMLAGLVSNIAALVIDKHSFYEQLKHGYVEEIKSEMA